MDKKQLEKQFIEKVKNSQGIVHKVCRMYCDDDEHRKDLFQEILIQLWHSFASYRGDAKFTTWMYRVALNVAIQDFRKVKKKRQFFLQTEKFKDFYESNSTDYTDEKMQLMYKAISTLNKVEKAIVMLHLDGKPNDEIASIIGITQNYVRVKMSRIKVKLSENVKRK